MLGSRWGIDDVPASAAAGRTRPSRPGRRTREHRFQVGLANDFIGYLIPPWAFIGQAGAIATTADPDCNTRRAARRLGRPPPQARDRGRRADRLRPRRDATRPQLQRGRRPTRGATSRGPLRARRRDAVALAARRDRRPAARTAPRSRARSSTTTAPSRTRPTCSRAGILFEPSGCAGCSASTSTSTRRCHARRRRPRPHPARPRRPPTPTPTPTPTRRRLPCVRPAQAAHARRAARPGVTAAPLRVRGTRSDRGCRGWAPPRPQGHRALRAAARSTPAAASAGACAPGAAARAPRRRRRDRHGGQPHPA